MAEELDGLTGKRARFVLYYCGPANCNGTQAAKDAGFAPGASRLTHQVTASRLLRDPKIKAAILKRFNDLTASGEEIMRRMTADARMSLEGMVTFDADGVASIRLTPAILKVYGTLIKEFELDEKGRVVKVKLNDSQAARRDIARVLQLFHDNPVINIYNLQELSNEEVAQRLVSARDRMTLRHYHGRQDNGGNGA